MSIKRKSTLSFFWGSSSNTFIQVFNFIIFVLLAKLLGAEKFGILAFSLLLMEMFSVFTQTGVNAYLIRKKEWETHSANCAFTMMMLLAASLAIISGTAISILYIFYEGNTSLLVTLGLLPTLLFNAAASVSNAKLQRDFRYKHIAKITTVSNLYTGLITIFLAYQGLDEWSLVIGRSLLSLTLLVWFSLSSRYSPRLIWDTGINRTIIHFVSPLFLTQILNFFSNKGSNMIIGLFLSPSVYAFYTMAKRPFDEFRNLTVSQLNTVLLNTLSRSDSSVVESTIYRLVPLISLVIAPAFLGLAATSELLIETILGNEWLTASYLMKIVSLQAFPFCLIWFISNIFIACGVTGPILKINVARCLLGLTLPLILLPYGAAAVIVSGVLSSLLTIPYTYKLLIPVSSLRLGKILRLISPSFIASVVMYFLITYYIESNPFSLNEPFIFLTTSIVIGAVIYLSIFLIFFRNDILQQFREIKGLLKT